MGVKEVIVATQHVANNGKHKLVENCTVPITGLEVVNTLVTEIAVFKFINNEMILVEHAADVTLDEIKAMTSAKYKVADDVKVWEVE